MADLIQKLLLQIDLDVNKTNQNLVAVTDNIVKLRTAQKKLQEELVLLQKSEGDHSAQIKNVNLALNTNKAEIEANVKVQRQYNAQLVQNVKGNIEQGGSINQLRANLSEVTNRWNELSKSERENSEQGKTLQAAAKAISDELKSQEASLGNTARNVGNYKDALTDLKQELLNIQGQLTLLDKNSDAYRVAAAKAGELQNKLRDIKQDIKSQAGDTGFEKLSNTASVLKDKLTNLDFVGVAAQAKQLQSIAQAMTFKEMISGLGGAVSALRTLAVTLLTNPLFLVAAAVVAITLALKAFSDTAEKRAVAATERLAASFKSQIQLSDDIIDAYKRITDAQINLAQAQNKSEEEILKQRQNQIARDAQYRVEQNADAANQINKLNIEAGRTTNDELRKQLNDQIKDLDDKVAKNKIIIKDSHTQIEILQAEHENKLRDIRNEAENINNQLIKDDLTREIAQEQEALKQSLERITSTGREATDLRTNLEQLSAQKIQDIKEKFGKEANEKEKKIQQDLIASRIQLITDAEQKEIAQEQASLQKKLEGVKKGSELFANETEASQRRITQIEIKFAQERQDAAIESETRKQNALVDIQKSLASSPEEKLAAELLVIQTVLQQQLAAIELANDRKVAEAGITAAQILAANQAADAEALAAVLKAGEDTLKATQDFNLLRQQQELDHLNTLVEIAGDPFTKIQAQLDADALLEQQQLANKELTEQQKDDIEKKHAKFRNDLKQQEVNAGLDLAKGGLEGLKKIAGENSAAGKAFSIAQSLINTYQGVTAALASAPPPFNIILAGITLGAGLKAVQNIVQTPLPKAEHGMSMMIDGKRHTEGGTKFYSDSGLAFEAEKDEMLVVLNRRATGALGNLSAWNQKYGGRSFASGGVHHLADGGVASRFAVSTTGQDVALSQLLDAFIAMPAPVVYVDDIHAKSQSESIRVERATH